MAHDNTSSGVKEDFFSNLPATRQHIIAVLILLLLPVILFDGAVLGGRTFIGHDIEQWRAGAESVINYEEETGETALWATNMFSGMPAYVVSYDKAVYHFDQLVRSVFESIFPAGHYWVMLIGLYLFFIFQGMQPLVALLGSIFIGLTTYIPIIIGAGHNAKFMAFAYIPWVLNGYWIMSRTPKRLLGFLVFAMALTLELRAGHPQVTYYFLYLLGFWWLFDSYHAWRRGEIKPWSTATGFMVLAGLLALLSNLQPYWSMYEYTPYTIRGGSALSNTGGLSLEYAFSWSQGVGELLTLIIPGLFGGSSAEAYWGPKSVTSGPHYFGAVAFILLLVGILRSKNRLKFLFLGVGTLTMLFSLGHHFESFNRIMFNYVPWFDKFRTPEMWLTVTIFCYSVVGVFGLEYLIEAARGKGKHLKAVALPVGIALGIGLVFTLGSGALLSFEKPGERQQYAQQVAQQNNLSPANPQVQQAVNNFINTELKPARRDIAGSDSTRYLVLTLIAAALVTALLTGKLSPGYFLIGMILLSSYDLISIGNRYSNEGAMVSEGISPEEVIQQQQRPMDVFLQENVESENGWPYRAFPLGDNPFNNAIPSYFYPTVGGYSGAKLSHYQDLIDNLLFTESGTLHMPILSMLNVKYISYPQQLPFEDLNQVYSGSDGYVYENPAVLPKAFFVDSIAYAGSAGEAVRMLGTENRFDPSTYAVVETDDLITAEPDTSGIAEVTTYTPNAIELQVSRSEPGFLVLSEIYYPKGWEAYLDGESIPIYKTNYVLRGVEIPAGDHQLRLTFEPASHTWGSRIAWAGNIIQWGIGIFLVVAWLRRRADTGKTE